jgi:hypothetical protein
MNEEKIEKSIKALTVLFGIFIAVTVIAAILA